MKGAVFIATSLDGFIARKDGGLDWLSTHSKGGEPGEDYGYQAFFESCDALLMGRRTFETVLGFGGRWPYGDKPVRVASRTLSPADVPEGLDSVRIVSGEAEEISRGLDAEGFDRVYVDGGAVVRAFLAAGLVREITLSLIPVLLGEGIPLFGPLEAELPLRHVETRSYASGLVRTRYEVRV